MNTLILKYERKTFFGSREYTEDRKDNATAEDVKLTYLRTSGDKEQVYRQPHLLIIALEKMH